MALFLKCAQFRAKEFLKGEWKAVTYGKKEASVACSSVVNALYLKRSDCFIKSILFSLAFFFFVFERRQYLLPKGVTVTSRSWWADRWTIEHMHELMSRQPPTMLLSTIIPHSGLKSLNDCYGTWWSKGVRLESGPVLLPWGGLERAPTQCK